MNKFHLPFVTTLALTCLILRVPGSGQTEGYYKDLFMDGGVDLTSRTTLPAADTLGLSWEYLATESIDFQMAVIVGDETDTNGRLLYPDGSPRFRVIYLNGGDSIDHGASLGEDGLNRIRDFYYRGSGYVGTCAGAIIICEGNEPGSPLEEYLGIWPGYVQGTDLAGAGAYTGHFIVPGSPLLNYFDFGGDMYIPNIYHWGGVYADTRFLCPPATEFLLRFDYPPYLMDNEVSCWAYQENDTTGRLVVIGSHPEGEVTGEGLQLMEAMLLYSLDGVAAPRYKAELVNGETRIMNYGSEEAMPEFAKLGDLQYHHFQFQVPEEAESFVVQLDGENDFDFNLFADADSFAFAGSADTALTSGGSYHYLVIPDPVPGEWSIGVKCTNTVEFTGISQGYSGDLSVLNGAAYTITAFWDTLDLTTVHNEPLQPHSPELSQNYPNPFNPITTISYDLPHQFSVTLTVYDVQGQETISFHNLKQPAGHYEVQWGGIDDSGNPVSTGVYFCRLQAGDYSKTIKMVYLR